MEETGANKIQSLSSLKAGQQVAIVRDHINGSVALIATITKVTTTQIVIGEKRYRKDNGVILGGSRGRMSWADSKEYLMLPDSHVVKTIRAREAIRRLINAVSSVKVPGSIEDCLVLIGRIEASLSSTKRSIDSL